MHNWYWHYSGYPTRGRARHCDEIVVRSGGERWRVPVPHQEMKAGDTQGEGRSVILRVSGAFLREDIWDK
ncbi:MAG: hypothetical protein KME26_05090 [Oscillatoria princeps RMCB-10]|nr:hypothetical protein [Oscillatoria princeps RMCB-10]